MNKDEHSTDFVSQAFVKMRNKQMKKDILAALDKGDIEGARDILLAQTIEEVGDSNSWDSPNYIQKVKTLQEAIPLDHSRSKLLTYFGLETLRDRYFLRSTDLKLVEGPQQFFARVAAGITLADQFHKEEVEVTPDIVTKATELYDVISKLWFMPATPVLTNTATDRGNLVSCFLSYMGDSITDIYKTIEECAHLGAGGGGLGVYMGDIRGHGAPIRKTLKSSGTIPFMKVLDSNTLAISQGSTRRASAAIYLDISHPDCEEYINIRKPTGGDENRKCLNIHHGVNITDDFMQAVNKKESFNIICPHTKEVVKTIDARTLWKGILKSRIETGEPFIFYKDTANREILPTHRDKGLFIKQSNLCCTPGHTLILTDKGHIPIKDLVGVPTNVWNGHEWSVVTPEYTGDKEIYEITLSDGTNLECSDNHKFLVQTGYTKTKGQNTIHKKIVEATDLQVGDKLQKCDYPVVEFDKTLDNAYTNGFFTGDGYMKEGNPQVGIYDNTGKEACVAGLALRRATPTRMESEGRSNWLLTKDLMPKFFIPENYSIKSKVDWLAGLFDADACISRNKNSDYLMYASINKDFIHRVSLMLQTLGVKGRVSKQHEGGQKIFKGKTINTKPLYILYITSMGLVRLTELGFSPRRLKYRNIHTVKNGQYFVEVMKIEATGITKPTYCFNEPKNHTAIFNGVYTGQSEILLPTNTDRTATCILGSINIEQCPLDQLEYVSAIATEALDNVLTLFLKTANPRDYKRAIYSASKERSIGLGLMGWHGYLMREKIPFEGVQSVALAKIISEKIQNAARAKSIELAKTKGECEDNPGNRNSYLTAIAPTANISIIAGNCTPCIEPIAGNAYLQKTLSGSFLVKNVYLENLLKEKGQNTAKVWKSIIKNAGSVQQLDFLSEEEKKLFKTAYELDQRFIIKQAAARQKHICQAQSLNLFFGRTENGEIDGMYLHQVHYEAWESGVKTLYYLRSDSVLSAKINTEECVACQ